EKFLSMQGLANEVPIFIQTYEIADEDQMTATVKALASRLRNAGIEAAELNLFGLLLEELKEEGLLDDFLAGEPAFDRVDLFNDLKNHADPKTRLVPRLVKRM